MLLLSGSGGYGFLATVEGMISRNKSGKAFIDLDTVGKGETICRPSHASVSTGALPLPPATHVACASAGGRILTFGISELKQMDKGGRGGKAREETLEIRSLNNARAARARKGKVADLGFKPTGIVRVE